MYKFQELKDKFGKLPELIEQIREIESNWSPEDLLRADLIDKEEAECLICVQKLSSEIHDQAHQFESMLVSKQDFADFYPAKSKYREAIKQLLKVEERLALYKPYIEAIHAIGGNYSDVTQIVNRRDEARKLYNSIRNSEDYQSLTTLKSKLGAEIKNGERENSIYVRNRTAFWDKVKEQKNTYHAQLLKEHEEIFVRTEGIKKAIAARKHTRLEPIIEQIRDIIEKESASHE